MKVILFVGQLNSGGAERQIINLAQGLSARSHKVYLVTIFPGGELCELVKGSSDLRHIPLWKNKSSFSLIRFIQVLFTPLILWIRIQQIRPEVVYSMLELSNIIAWLSTRFGFGDHLVWGLRSGKRNLELKQSLPEKFSILVSKTVSLIITNSEAGKEHYFQKGYRPENIVSIPNGIDIDYFKPDHELRENARAEYGIASKEFVIGVVGRIHPVKNLEIFFEAAAAILRSFPGMIFAVVGDGKNPYINTVKEHVRELHIEDHVTWLGYQGQMVGVYNMLDLLILSSTVEGFPNVVGEAMACGVPCIVTDVGDAAVIANDPTRVVAPGDSGALEKAIHNFLSVSHPQQERSLMRVRITENFSLDAMVERTLEAFSKYIPGIPENSDKR